MELLAQTDRLLQLITPLDEGELLLVHMKGREAISELFCFDLEMISENGRIRAADLIAKPATVGLACQQDFRYINGFVSEFLLLSTADRFARYRARIVPWLWFLTRTTDCAIYQNKSVPEIIQAVFSKYELRDYKFRLVREHLQREYCVQYRETACNFLMRLMEDEGICFYFEHCQTRHTLVLADEPSAHEACPLQNRIRWEPSGGTGFNRDEDYIFDWVRRYEVRPKTWTQADYDFKKPRFHLNSSAPTRSQLAVPDLERYDYPGRFQTLDEAERYTRLRMEEEEASMDVVAGDSHVRTLVPGYRFRLEDHFRRDQNAEYLVTSVQHEAHQDVFSRVDISEEWYQNHFSCIPRGTAFRPPRITPRPVVAGPQTAFVTGPEGEEIYTDKYGRVKVQFHWDRRGAYDAQSSCWVRVSQTLAGKGWGSVQLPRVGQEVIVDFLDGDPDRPLITGRVYNAEHLPPYELPAGKAKTTLRTMSYPGGDGFNELRFDDAKEKEQIFIHAQRNFDLRVRHDYFTTVLSDSHSTISNDSMVKVGGDQHVTVVGDQNLKVGGTISFEAGNDWLQRVGANHGIEAGNEVHLKAGMNVVIESGVALTLKVGGNFININPEGVFIQGNLVMINSGGAAGTGAGVLPATPKLPQDADLAKPGMKGMLPKPPGPPKPVHWSPQAVALKQAHENGTPFCEVCERSHR